MSTTDVVIIGGGVIGSAAAYELARRNVAVTLLERDLVGTAQSGRNWGFVRQQGRSAEELPLMRAANARWQALEAETGSGFDWVQGGNLAFAENHTAAQQYREWVAVSRDKGLDTRLVAPGEVQQLVPGLRLPHTAAIYTASDGHAEPVPATRALAQGAKRHGASIIDGCCVHAIHHHSGRVRGVRTDRGDIHADKVICAAGTASRPLLRTIGIQLPQNIVRGTVATTEPTEPFLSTAVWASGLAFRQRRDGRLVLSTGGGGEVDLTLDILTQANWFLPAFRHNHRRFRLRLNTALFRSVREYLGGQPRTAEPRPNLARAHTSLLRLRQALPALTHLRLEHAWAGLIDATPDGLPILDRPGNPPGLLVATGFSGHGFGLAPAVGQTLADLATEVPPQFDLTPFRLQRFAEGAFYPPTAIL